nr:DUF4366 domain-containing protein [uncultured Eisenbergiella sp.]
MKNRILPLLTALVLCISVFALPLTAYAASSDDKTPPTLTATLEKGRLTVEAEDDISGVEAVYIDGRRISTLVNGKGDVALKDYAGDGKQITVYAVDFAGNRSKEQKFDNPYYKAPTSTPSPNTQSGGTASKPQTTPTPTPTPKPSSTPSETPSSGGDGTVSAVPDGAFTPDGAGTIQDSATGEEGDKQFYTITTEAGNTFYLIIDGKREDKNVYFLNTVTEADLMALAEKENGTVSAAPEPEKCTCGEKCEAGKVNTACPVCKNDLTGCTGKTPTPAPEQPDDQKPEEKGGGNVGMIVFVLIAFAAVGGAGYYFKIVRPKQQAALDDEDEGFEGDEYGDGYDPGLEQGEEYLPDDNEDDDPAQGGK